MAIRLNDDGTASRLPLTKEYWLRMHNNLERDLKLGLMLANIHSGDSDCIGKASRELIESLKSLDLDLDALYEEFDC